MTDRQPTDDKEMVDCTKPSERTRTGTPRKSSMNYARLESLTCTGY